MKDRIFNFNIKQGILAAAMLVPAVLNSQVTNVTYDFNARNVAVIAGQDNWQYSGNMNTSNNLSGNLNCALPSAASPADIVNTTTSGLYTGGRGLRNRGSGNTHGFTSRKNNAAWSYTIPAAGDYLILEFDYDSNNWWGEFVNLGYDKNGDGNYNSNCNTADANEIGIGLSITNTGIFLYRADGTTATAPRVGTGWTRYRITVDLRANGGQGSGSVCYRLLGSSGAWQQVAGLQNIVMNINAASLNQNNLQRLDGIVVQQEAGGDGIVDNISISTYRNTALLPVALCPGATLNLSAVAIPNTTVYQWMTPAGTTFTTSVPAFTLSPVAPNHNGTFTLSTNDCPALTWTVPVTVYPTPTITSVSSATICSGGDPNITLTASPASTYSWVASNNPNTTGESLTAQTTGVISNTILSSSAVAEKVTYSVTPTSTLGNCTGAMQLVEVTVNPAPSPTTVSITASASTVCAGTTVSFTATPSNGGTAPQYQWQINGVNTGTASGPVFSSAALNDQDVVSVILTSNALCASSFTATSNTLTLTVNPVFVPSVLVASSGATICAGSNISFTATPTHGGSSPTYQWQVNGVNAGTGPVFSSATLNQNDAVQVILTSNTLCASPATATSNTITVIISPPLVPAVSIAASSPSICAGSIAGFTATAVNGGTSPNYRWLVNGANAGAGPVFSSGALTNADRVSVVMTSNAFCVSPATVSSNTITVTVLQSVTASVAVIPETLSICEGTGVNFVARPSNGGTAPVYQWQINGTNTGGNSPVFSSASLANGDRITVTMVSDMACVSPSLAVSVPVTMSVTPVPIASFVYAPSQLTDLAPEVSFQNTSQNSTSWSWYFGTSGTSQQQHPVYSFPGPGSYEVRLEARNGACSHSVTQIITIEAVSTYYIPDAFTPNGDLVNDGFGVVGYGISDENYNMSIFNRWGELLYKTSSAAEFWDGKAKGGALVPEDVYVYKIEFELQGITKEKVSKAGYVTVLR